MDNFSAI